jgi:hypothetical protein
VWRGMGGRIEVLYRVHAMVWCSEVVLIIRSRNGESSRVMSGTRAGLWAREHIASYRLTSSRSHIRVGV